MLVEMNLQAKWSDPDREIDYVITFAENNQQRLIEMTVRRVDGEPITHTADLRKIPYHTLLTELRKQGSSLPLKDGQTFVGTKDGRTWTVHGDGILVVVPPRPNRRKLDRAFCQEVADLYQEAIRRGIPPNVRIEENYGVPYSTATRWVQKARHEYGLLPPTEQGKARG